MIWGVILTDSNLYIITMLATLQVQCALQTLIETDMIQIINTIYHIMNCAAARVSVFSKTFLNDFTIVNTISYAEFSKVTLYRKLLWYTLSIGLFPWKFNVVLYLFISQNATDIMMCLGECLGWYHCKAISIHISIII